MLHEVMLFLCPGARYPGGEAPDPGDGVQDVAARLPRRAHHRAQLLQRQLECLVPLLLLLVHGPNFCDVDWNVLTHNELM